MALAKTSLKVQRGRECFRSMRPLFAYLDSFSDYLITCLVFQFCMYTNFDIIYCHQSGIDAYSCLISKLDFFRDDERISDFYIDADGFLFVFFFQEKSLNLFRLYSDLLFRGFTYGFFLSSVYFFS